MTLLQVPVLDITPLRGGDVAARRRLAVEIDRACRNIGFLVISGHGVSETMLAEVASVSRAFFSLDESEKQRVARPAADIARGYIGLGAESVARSQGVLDAPGDLNESLMIGPVDVPDAPYYHAPMAGRHFYPNLWPAQPAALRPLYERCFRDLSQLAATIMRGFALALDLDERFFDPLIDRHIIPTCLSNDCFDPVSLGDRSDLFWHLHELVPGVSAGGKDFVVAVPDLMA